jgi:hypothetical protein
MKGFINYTNTDLTNKSFLELIQNQFKSQQSHISQHLLSYIKIYSSEGLFKINKTKCEKIIMNEPKINLSNNLDLAQFIHIDTTNFTDIPTAFIPTPHFSVQIIEFTLFFKYMGIKSTELIVEVQIPLTQSQPIKYNYKKILDIDSTKLNYNIYFRSTSNNITIDIFKVDINNIISYLTT